MSFGMHLTTSAVVTQDKDCDSRELLPAEQQPEWSAPVFIAKDIIVINPTILNVRIQFCFDLRPAWLMSGPVRLDFMHPYASGIRIAYTRQ